MWNVPFFKKLNHKVQLWVEPYLYSTNYMILAGSTSRNILFHMLQFLVSIQKMVVCTKILYKAFLRLDCY